ncbi:hypothetical protein M4951_08600 [Blastopirellula sp. J2-11]|uniref:hypothetical protein n=1 Tax=Blastopirellula sp. J2-11 TaxID=2943192 RepID=UPI0021C8FB2C|nr:hypothetical protein [Blastopirellula sp. J2-11]UUO08360.1 hypothetical protein M4951_08600 [Blastopirellula sp. J2-11]
MSDTPHSIRLNGPWQAYFAADADPTRIQLPRDWSTIPAATRDADFKLMRAFHAPTGIAPGDEVVLVLDELPISGKVSLNGQELGVFSRSERFAITEHLALRHEIEIVGLSLDAGERAGEVRLEIFVR